MKSCSWKTLLVMIVFLVVMLVKMDTHASEVHWEGAGTISDPYLLYTIEDIVVLRNCVNNGLSFKNTYFRQMNNISFESIDNWIPIGLLDSNTNFEGVYDGNGFYICDITIMQETGSGFFGVLSGKVLNLGIESGYISGSCSGSITSQAIGSDASIINCYNKATITGDRVGGIADNFSGLIANCWNAGTLSATEIGGIVSYNAKKIIYCYSEEYELTNANFTGIISNSRIIQNYNEEEFANTLNENIVSMYSNGIVNLKDTIYTWDFSDKNIGFVSPYHYPYYKNILIYLLVSLMIALVIICVYCLVSRIKLVDFVIQIKASDLSMTIMICILTFAGIMCITSYVLGDSNITNFFFFQNLQDSFMDLFNPMIALREYLGNGLKDYSEAGSSYPPLARLIIYGLSLFIPQRYFFTDAYVLRNNIYGIALYAVFVFVILFFVYSICSGYCFAKTGRNIVLIYMLFSAPMIYLLGCGNVLLVAYALSLFFVLEKENDSPLIKHLRWIALAVAAGIKIYPAVLGVLLIKEKKYKESLMCVIYGVSFYVVPFIFMGGLKSIPSWISNLTYASTVHNASSIASRIDLNALCLDLSKHFEVFSNTLFINMLKVLVIILILICIFLSKEKWECVLALVLGIALIPSFNYYYVGVYFGLPLFLFFCAETHKRKSDILFAILLSLLVVPFQMFCGRLGGTVELFYAIIRYIEILLLFVLCISLIVKEKEACA